MAALTLKPQRRIVSGGLILLVATTLVNLGNYLFNLLLARWLPPAVFADVSLIITLMLTATVLTMTLQIAAAKITAGATDSKHDTLSQLLQRWAWLSGCAAALILVAGAPFWQQFFRTASWHPFALLGLGFPIYLVQGVQRGVLQGQLRFERLAGSYVAEMMARLILSLGLVALGFGAGAVAFGLSLSFAASYVVARQPKQVQAKRDWTAARPLLWATVAPIALVNLSQILINNSDVLIVKRYFAAEAAGQYAALALIGRVVFFASISIVTILFPAVAERHKQDQSTRPLFWGALALVGSMSLVAIAGTYLFPDPIVMLLFGANYRPIAPLLWQYATATALYSLANVVITYRLACDDRTCAKIALGGGVLQVVLLTLIHGSLQQVVLLQIGLMGAMFLILILFRHK